MKINHRDIKNILIVRNDRFGEFLLNIPALRALKETFQDAHIIAVVNPYVRELAEALPFINEMIEWAPVRHSLTQKFKLLKKIKSKNIDIAVMLNPSKDFNIITFLAGIPIRIGYDRKLGFLLTHKVKDKKYLAEKHEVEYNLELVGLVGAKTQDKNLNLNIDEKVVGIPDQVSLVAVHPFTSDPVKQWPIKNFVELATRLIKELKTKVVIIGGKEQLHKSLAIFNQFPQDLIDMTGKTTLRQLAAILKKCRLLISGDSGPVHLACAVGTPVVAIFRNDIPEKSVRRWGPWDKKSAVIEKARLQDITVDEVLHKIKEML